MQETLEIGGALTAEFTRLCKEACMTSLVTRRKRCCPQYMGIAMGEYDKDK